MERVTRSFSLPACKAAPQHVLNDRVDGKTPRTPGPSPVRLSERPRGSIQHAADAALHPAVFFGEHFVAIRRFILSFCASLAIELEELLGLKRPTNGPTESTTGRLVGSSPVGDASKGPSANVGVPGSDIDEHDDGDSGDSGSITTAVC